ncbi:MAG: DUF427 domain-containing protein [Actinobacteria bacterium]|nr:DUF427 domain-containing protein [Actinomycetota bacterium]
MLRAVWNGAVIAEAATTMRLEGNHYFPPESLHREHLRDSPTRSVCPWKGSAHYYDIVVDGQVNPTAAWYYPNPSRPAHKISGHVAFWNGVCVEGAADPAPGTNHGTQPRWWQRRPRQNT